MRLRAIRVALALTLTTVLTAGVVMVIRDSGGGARTYITAYFENSNGIFVGDHVRILGVTVGKIEEIEPQPERAKITFWVDPKYDVPADVNAVIVAPTLVTARTVQLTPAYISGPRLETGAVLEQDRTAVPMEWDDVRDQLEKLTDTLQPTEPGGVSTLGAFINTAAENLRGEGDNIRAAVMELSQTLSALGDHSGDVFGTLRNMGALVSALRDSTTLMENLNHNMAAITGLLANDEDEVAVAMRDLHEVVGRVQEFVADNRETVGTTSDQLASITSALNDKLWDVKDALHLFPNAFGNFLNIYQPAQGAFTGAISVNNFADPINFICGAIQAASRMGAEESAKLCVQYMAPIVKNRQYNFPPVGANPFVGAMARPNEITYSEDWLRPDYVPPAAAAPGPPPTEPEPMHHAPLGAEAVSVDPANGLAGLMMPAQGGGS